MKRFLLSAVAVLCACFSIVPAAAAQTHQASLTWTEPTTTIPYAFNVYRAVQSGASCPVWGSTSWTLLQGSIGASSPAWVDTTISSGVTYCYAVTAYNNMGTGGEAAPSNIISLPDPSVGSGSTGTPPSPGGLVGKRT